MPSLQQAAHNSDVVLVDRYVKRGLTGLQKESKISNLKDSGFFKATHCSSYHVDFLVASWVQQLSTAVADPPIFMGLQSLFI